MTSNRTIPLRPVSLLLSLASLWMLGAAPNGLAETKKKEPKPIVTAASVLEEAQLAYARGDRANAMSLINKAIHLEPNNSRGYFARARLESTQGNPEKALEDYNKVIALDPSSGDVYQLRGLTHFELGHPVDAVQDFNHYLTLSPDQIPHHWQRGIAYYYCDRYAEGRRQFELHQEVNPQDVENAAWHFFCVARVEGVEKARALLLPVTLDSRVPMMQILALLAGKATPDDVIAAATAGNPTQATRQRQLFHAHLYLGLYHEVMKEEKQSREHIAQAVELAAKGDYMGIVAKVHSKLRKGAGKGK
ncbi:MAG TPA: hypothetical protein DCM86_15990 [Verrucomicrobiales bacterium]|nr:hypothetical protein [Verrucomicrobiales bacterium]